MRYHYQGPDKNGQCFIYDGELEFVTVVSALAAKRIVYCLNAMEGIDDPAAARVILDEPATQYARDLLLGCKGALTALLLSPHVDKQQAIDYLREVLAKVEPKNASDETPCFCKDLLCPKRHYEVNS